MAAAAAADDDEAVTFVIKFSGSTCYCTGGISGLRCDDYGSNGSTTTDGCYHQREGVDGLGPLS
jgi:hypothetical protein